MKRYFLLLFVLSVLGVIVFSPSCANTTQSPSGGPKDTIPPYIVNIKPLPGVANVPVNIKEVEFHFNEYVVIKDAKSIIISPPLQKQLKSRISGKRLIVEFDSELQEGTTYSISLGNAIADNNEGNMFPGFTYSFSTGSSIDSMILTGTVQDSRTLEPVKGASVLLYKDHSDSAVFLKKPYAVASTDDWGYFYFPFIKDTLYRLYAISDGNSNLMYDPGSENIAFVDGSVSPSLKVNDTLPEFMKYDMRDTLACLARRSQYELMMFREKPSKQFIKGYGMSSVRGAFVSFNAPDTWIDSLWVKGYPSNRIISQFNTEQDSLCLWINDRRPVPDTLRLVVNYRKTDSLGHMVPFAEELELDNSKNNSVYKRANRKKLTQKDTTCTFKVTATPESIEKNGFVFSFDNPITNADFKAIELSYINTKQKKIPVSFEVTRDSSDLRTYSLIPSTKYQRGSEYTMKVPPRIFRDINGFYSDSLDVKVSLPNDDRLSTISLDIKNVDGKYIVDLLAEKNRSLVLSYTIDRNCSLLFPYLKSGNYYIRITSDLNLNSQIDPGSLLLHRQPEKVRYFMQGGKKLIPVPEGADLQQTIEIKEMFE